MLFLIFKLQKIVSFLDPVAYHILTLEERSKAQDLIKSKSKVFVDRIKSSRIAELQSITTDLSVTQTTTPSTSSNSNTTVTGSSGLKIVRLVTNGVPRQHASATQHHQSNSTAQQHQISQSVSQVVVTTTQIHLTRNGTALPNIQQKPPKPPTAPKLSAMEQLFQACNISHVGSEKPCVINKSNTLNIDEELKEYIHLSTKCI